MTALRGLIIVYGLQGKKISAVPIPDVHVRMPMNAMIVIKGMVTGKTIGLERTSASVATSTRGLAR